jgi:methylase of polypeptide subunit release factors
VFFGPDTYLFVRALEQFFACRPDFQPRHVLELGAGSGVAGLYCAQRFLSARVTLVDINQTALGFCDANSDINALKPKFCTVTC